MKGKKWFSLLMVAVMALSLVATGCGSKAGGNTGTGSDNKQTSGSNDSATKGLPDLELWCNNIYTKGVEKNGPMYNFYKDILGVGLYQPYVEWNGGQTYQEQLNLRISAGEMPDMFMPVNGMEADLIKNGGLLDLTDLLPEKAPHLWEVIPEEVWDIVRSYDPSGEGRIYVIPNVVNFARMGGMVRQDWLDALGMEVPTTQEEYVEMLRAFKTKDPNGNGVQDEIPTGGRAEARWMDHLFAMYGIAMFEGYPDWDIYDGEITYSAVTTNMRDALQWLSKLYAEGLMDPETLLNDKAGWEGKVNSNRVGSFYHWISASYQYVENLENGTGVIGSWTYLPVISAPGYEGFYTQKQLGSMWMVCANTNDEAKIEAMMKVLDGFANSDNWEAFLYGPEGYSWNYNEKGQKISVDATDLENVLFYPPNTFASIDGNVLSLDMMIGIEEEEFMVTAMEQSKSNMYASKGKPIAGDGLPSSVYEGYPDILNRTLYVEYASKIIAGEWPIEKFDEFVEKWYASGGEEVTKRVREWYAEISK